MLPSHVAILHDNAVHGEDTYLVRDLGNNAFLDAVMDGVTGRRGAEASQAVQEDLAAAALTSPDDVVAVLSKVNERLYRRSLGPLWLTTVSAALYLGDKLYVLGVGDSPVLLIQHHACQRLLSGARGFSHSAMAGAVGAHQNLRRLLRDEVVLVPGDRVVLATDGITDNVTTEELAEIIRHAAAPDEAVAHLRTLLTARQREDRSPTPLGARFQHDDRTAIVRFFPPLPGAISP
jgi:serine/threonine protein phosphatase PrpC